MAVRDIRYESLPEFVRSNLSEDQFDLARVDIVYEGESVPETTEYVDLGTGVRRVHHAGELAPGDLLPAHDLAGARGKNYSQWQQEHRF